MLLGSLLFPGNETVILYPIALGGAAIIASVIGTFAFKLGKSNNIMNALFMVVGALSAAGMLAAALQCNQVLCRAEEAERYARALIALEPDNVQAQAALAAPTPEATRQDRRRSPTRVRAFRRARRCRRYGPARGCR